MYTSLTLLALFTLIYSVVAKGLERTWLSGPLLFTVFGALVGPLGLGWIEVRADAESLRLLAELTLAVVLFTDAAGADLGVLRQFGRMPRRLLLVGLPLTILLGWAAGLLLFGALSVVEAALLGAMLAPTDAALGKGVITNTAVPDPVRQALNVESGLNDGICVPVVLLLLAIVEDSAGTGLDAWRFGAGLFLQSLGIGAVVGAALAACSAALLHLAHGRNWLSAAWTKITVVALAFACFGGAQSLGGSGFIAAFVGGLLFGVLLKRHRSMLLTAAEGIGDSLSLVTWGMFGAAVVGPALTVLAWRPVLYAALSLTVIRMAPVYLSLAGLGLSREARLFTGWFGPRGLASVVFGVLALDAELPEGRLLTLIVVWTIILSVVAHGVTAPLWARGFGAREARRSGGEPS